MSRSLGVPAAPLLLRGPSGPPGADGADGEPGPPGADGTSGSPDTAAQVLIKLLTVDGPGSGLNADLLDGFDAADFATAVNLAAHEADTTAVHGIADTTLLVLTGDSRLTNARTPTGAAGGVLAGTYPNPSFVADMATQAELDAHVLATGAHDATKIANTPAGTIAATTVQAALNELDAEKLTAASNLADLANVVTARSSLGLGGGALLNVGLVAGTLAAGDDSRLTNARVPTAHASTHASGGTDAITISESQVTSLTADLAAKLALAGGTLSGALIGTSSTWSSFVGIGATPASTGALRLTAGTTATDGIQFGSDVSLFRLATGLLKTAGTLLIGGATSTGAGGGGAQGASINTNGTFQCYRTSTTQNVIATGLITDTVLPRFTVTANGTLSWGDGAIAPDTNLYRSATDTLKTDDSFAIGANIVLSGATAVTGTPAAATDLATALALLNDLRTKLLAVGVVRT